MVAPKSSNKQVTDTDKKKETPEEAEFKTGLAKATKDAEAKSISGCLWVTYKGVTPERAQPSIMVQAPGGRSYRFYRDIKKQLDGVLAKQLADTNPAFKLEG